MPLKTLWQHFRRPYHIVSVFKSGCVCSLSKNRSALYQWTLWMSNIVRCWLDHLYMILHIWGYNNRKRWMAVTKWWTTPPPCTALARSRLCSSSLVMLSMVVVGVSTSFGSFSEGSPVPTLTESMLISSPGTYEDENRYIDRMQMSQRGVEEI